MQLLSTCKCGWRQKMKIVKKQQIKLRIDLGQKKKKKRLKRYEIKT